MDTRWTMRFWRGRPRIATVCYFGSGVLACRRSRRKGYLSKREVTLLAKLCSSNIRQRHLATRFLTCWQTIWRRKRLAIA